MASLLDLKSRIQGLFKSQPVQNFVNYTVPQTAARLASSKPVQAYETLQRKYNQTPVTSPVMAAFPILQAPKLLSRSEGSLGKFDPGSLYGAFSQSRQSTDPNAMSRFNIETAMDVAPGVAALTKSTSGFKKAGDILKEIQPVNIKERGFVKVARGVSKPNDIIQQARKEIGKTPQIPDRPIKQTFDDIYTQWVDRYHPLVKASNKVKVVLKSKGAMLRPEADPTYLVRRLTGAGGIADQRFKEMLNPVLKKIENLKIDKTDMDVYLANKRIAGFGNIGREVYGADSVKAKEIVAALEAKYGPSIQEVAGELYKYQDDGLNEIVRAGFMSEETAAAMRSQNPDYAPLFRVMDEIDDYLGLPTRKTMQGSQPIKRIKGSTRQILSPLESIIGNTFSQRAAIEKNNVARSIVRLQEISPELGFNKVSKAGEDTITVWNNGNKEYWSVGREIADVAKGANEEAMNTVLKIIQAPASLLRQAATGRNPEFMIPNVIRDQLDAGITSKYGYVPFIDYVSGLKSMLTNDEVYRKWANSGAKIDLGELSGRKSVSQMFDEKKADRSLFKFLGKTLDVMGKYSEQPTRVGLFKKAYKKTGNELLSMMESRDSTVDFARMGSKMKVANSLIPFLNVGVQGFDKLVRSIKDRPAKVLLTAATYGAAPAVLSTLYNLTNFSEEYAEIPQYEKDSNFVLVMGRNEDGTVDYVTIPKGNVIPTISNPIQSFIEYAFGQDQRSFTEMATNVLSNTLPVVGDGSSLKEVAIKTVGQNIPQAIKPITENLVNKSFYKYDTNKEQTKDIVPFYLQDKPAYQQDYEFTPVMYKKIGALLNVSPLQVKNAMEGYLAGYTKIPAQVIQVAVDASNGNPVNPNDKTLLRRFIKQTYETKGIQTQPEKASVPGVMDRLVGKVSASDGELPTIDNDFKMLYQDATNTVEGYAENSSKIRTGLKKSQTLEEAQSELVRSKHLLQRMEREEPERVYEIGLEVYNSDGGKNVEERANWAEKWLNKAQGKEQFESWYQGMLNSGVMTKSVLEKLKEKGIDLPYYISGGKIKAYTSGTKPKKITISKVSVKPVKITKSKGIKVQTLKLPNPPNIKKPSVKAIKIVAGPGKVKQYKIKTYKNTLTQGFTKLV